MSMTSTPVHSQPAPASSRLRNAAIGTLFALALTVPKILHLRRNPNSWLLFRILLGVTGAAFVILPLGLGNSYVLSVAGLVLFVSSILLPPAKPDTSIDDKARELGALVVVNGGRYRLGKAPPAAVRLFVSPERICVLNAHFEPLLAIAANEIASVHVEESAGQWMLRMIWADQTAELIYRGVFAEHLARIAETTLRGVMRPALPALPQRRAASA
jgi:hypothetical protein